MRRIKDRSLLRNDLGLTQEELAILLTISISLIAMYETKKRELPSAVSLQLTQMYLHLLQKKQQKVDHSKTKQEQKQLIELLEEELKKNELHQRNCHKKLETMKAKYEKAIANLFLMDYFEGKETDGYKPSINKATYLEILAEDKLPQNGLAAQKKCTLQLETLEWQHGRLLEELKQLK
jgi:transcriptional regulator with XRE-family HTH domain